MSAAFLHRSQRLGFILVFFGVCRGLAGAAAADDVDAVLPRLGVTRGLCVVLGDAKGELAVKLARASELLIYVQLPRSENVAAVRRAAADAGLYGTRIYVAQGNLTPLYLADNLADALIAIGDAADVSDAEVLRVLRQRAKRSEVNKNWSSLCRTAWIAGAIPTTARTTTRNRKIALREART